MSKYFNAIVVGVDFSSYSKTVFRQAQLLSRKYSAPLVAVHGFKGYSLLAGQEVHKEVIKVLKDQMAEFYGTKTSETELVVKYGAPDEVLIKAAGLYSRPLIVVGHVGQSKISRYFLGSVAEKVALKSPFSVWVHRGTKVVTAKRILFPFDLSVKSRKALVALQKMAAGKSKISLCYVQHPTGPLLDYEAWRELQMKTLNKEKLEIKKARLAFRGMPFKIFHGDPASVILKHTSDYDVVALTPHSQHSAFQFGSVTAKIVRSANRPLLVLHP